MPSRPPPPDGVACLVEGRPVDALVAFERDPDDVGSRTGRAAALAELGGDGLAEALDELARRPGRTTVERHHVEIVVLALTGRGDRATGLGREHLVDHPDDRLVRHVLARWCPGAQDLR